MRCALGTYRVLWGEMGIKPNAALLRNLVVLYYRRLATSCTSDSILEEKSACLPCVLETAVLLVLSHCTVNEERNKINVEALRDLVIRDQFPNF